MKSKYIYHYPDQIKIAKNLFSEDRVRIAEKLNYSIDTVNAWCKGTRRNKMIMKLAKYYAEINIESDMIKSKVDPDSIK